MFYLFYLIGIAVGTIALSLFLKNETRLSTAEKFVMILVCLPFSWCILVFIGIAYSSDH